MKAKKVRKIIRYITPEELGMTREEFERFWKLVVGDYDEREH